MKRRSQIIATLSLLAGLALFLYVALAQRHADLAAGRCGGRFVEEIVDRRSYFDGFVTGVDGRCLQPEVRCRRTFLRNHQTADSDSKVSPLARQRASSTA